jgi:hypothetical protein
VGSKARNPIDIQITQAKEQKTMRDLRQFTDASAINRRIDWRDESRILVLIVLNSVKARSRSMSQRKAKKARYGQGTGQSVTS